MTISLTGHAEIDQQHELLENTVGQSDFFRETDSPILKCFLLIKSLSEARKYFRLKSKLFFCIQSGEKGEVSLLSKSHLANVCN